MNTNRRDLAIMMVTALLIVGTLFAIPVFASGKKACIAYVIQTTHYTDADEKCTGEQLPNWGNHATPTACTSIPPAGINRVCVGADFWFPGQ